MPAQNTSSARVPSGADSNLHAIGFRGDGCANAASALWGRGNERGCAHGFLLRSRQSPENGSQDVFGRVGNFQHEAGGGAPLHQREAVGDQEAWHQAASIHDPGLGCPRRSLLERTRRGLLGGFALEVQPPGWAARIRPLGSTLPASPGWPGIAARLGPQSVLLLQPQRRGRTVFQPVRPGAQKPKSIFAVSGTISTK